ncbi:hypothetical protein [Acetilactobacillus jinshanensis]|uniref:hypothetical protein n=1 Tax=Acetilactobacillus jinshanensis TaxID=1720083 RepID=UPI0013A66F89|nr:hypothetical protein [Acetilactobacillus jinshanensis]URL60897.1 hypothetical protein HGK75_02510 [uncultured bacterium]
MSKILWWTSTIFWIIMFIIGFSFFSNHLLRIGLIILLIIIAGLQITLFKAIHQ